MKIKEIIKISWIFIIPALLVACEEEDNSPKPDFSTDSQVVSEGESISFTDQSSNNPLSWEWTFEGGTPQSSTSQNPIVEYNQAGTYDVTLTVKNEDGENTLTKTDLITVNQTVTFYNNGFAPIYITVAGEDATIDPEDSYTFTGITTNSVDFDAETYGSTSDGTQIGELLYWESSVDLTVYNGMNLNISSDYVFFYVTNNGSGNLNPFYVNYGGSDQTMDDIIIYNDGNKKTTGYYVANDYMQVRADYTNSSNSYSWNEGTNFYLPWSNNQSIHLACTSKDGKNIPNMEYEVITKDIKAQEGHVLFETGVKK
ncbi:MAG: PKD domain-containing protein [Bacteroidales bacterium]